MNKLLLYILFFMTVFNVYSQQSINGIVTDIYDFPISDVSIILYQQNDTLSIKSHTTTNSNGEFNLSIPDNKSYLLEASSLGYETKKTKITSNKSIYKIILEENYITLQDIVVTATVMSDVIELKRDTLKFNENATLKDILKDNVGVEISDGDGIKYMGVPINKILINKKEVFVNQNSLAINNLTNEMIDKIQIINNHKDKFNIDFDNFEETVINVDVKRKFRGTIKTEFEILGGYKYAFDANAKSMFFSDKFNAFLTQNTNNLNERKANLSEISLRYSNPSSFYEQNINQIIFGEENVKKDLSNNTYLLLKREEEKLKSSLNLGYLIGKQTIENQTEIAQISNVLSTENSLMKQKGNLFYGDLNGTYLLNKGFSLFLNSKIDFSHNNINWETNKNIFPNSHFNNLIDNKNYTFLMENTIGSKKLINNNWLLNTELTHYIENSNYEYINSNSNYQKVKLRNNNFNVSSELSYQHSKMFNLGTKLQYRINDETANDRTQNSNSLNRNYQYGAFSLISRGRNKKIYYFIQIGTSIYSFKENSKWIFPVSTSFNYRISSKKSINFSYENNWNISSLENNLDSLYSKNNMLILSSDFSDNLSRNQTAIIEYNISSITKSKGISFMIIGNKHNDFTQLVIRDITNNLTAYERLLFNSRNSVSFKHRYSKGYYFSPKYHQIRWGYNIGLNLSKGDVFYNNDYEKLITKGYNFGLSVGFVFQDLFLTNLSLKNSFNPIHSIISNSTINKITTNTTALYIDKILDQYDFSLEAYRQHFFTDNKTVERYDINLSAQYKLNKNTSIKMYGKSLFSLFKTPDNNANISTNSNTGYNVTVINENILGYATIGINYKF
ncbi:hypothetical protein GO491_04370 [Flavobacteriaceae bacterium Ap0902]|nr:hypothetical protein [Flavobacteriaceae bacterium Ap0902]